MLTLNRTVEINVPSIRLPETYLDFKTGHTENKPLQIESVEIYKRYMQVIMDNVMKTGRTKRLSSRVCTFFQLMGHHCSVFDLFLFGIHPFNKFHMFWRRHQL